MKKLLIGIFISLSAFFLMSYNASAVTTVYDLSNYDPIVNQVYSTVDCNISGTNKSNVTWCSLDNSSGDKQLNKLVTHNSFTLKKDDIIEFDVINVTRDTLTSITNFNYVAMKPNDVNNLRMITTNQVVNIHGETSYVVNGTVYHWGNVNSVMRMTYKVINDSYIPIGVLATDLNNNPSAIWHQGVSGLMWNIVDLTIYRKSGVSETNKEQEEATQNAVDDSETSGSNSQSSSEGATNSLLSVFTGFANVITNASPSSCVINAPLNTTFSSDRLNVDLCGLDLPPAIGTLTSIIAVMVVVPFAISMFNKFIGIMQGFQR